MQMYFFNSVDRVSGSVFLSPEDGDVLHGSEEGYL